MPKKNESEDKSLVKKQTLISAIVLSLFVGFIGGTIYSSFKLAGDNKARQQQSVSSGNGPAAAQQDNSAEIASRIMQLEQYLKTNPKDAEAWAQLGNQFFDSNQITHAIEAYKKSLDIEPDKVGVITDLGVMYRRNKQPEKAIETFDKAIAIDPKFETAHFNKGIVLLHDLNDLAGGVKAWEGVLAINPMAMAPNGESIDALIQRMKNK